MHRSVTVKAFGDNQVNMIDLETGWQGSQSVLALKEHVFENLSLNGTRLTTVNNIDPILHFRGIIKYKSTT